MTSRQSAARDANLVQAWEPGLLSRMRGAANGGSAKSPEERERLDEEHQGKDLDKPAGVGDGAGSSGSKTPELPEASRDRSD